MCFEIWTWIEGMRRLEQLLIPCLRARLTDPISPSRPMGKPLAVDAPNRGGFIKGVDFIVDTVVTVEIRMDCGFWC